MKLDYFLPGYITAVTHAERLTCSGLGYVQDKSSTGIKAPPTDQSDRSVLLENDIIVHKRSCGARSTNHESLKRKSEFTEQQTFLNLSEDFYKNDLSV